MPETTISSYLGSSQKIFFEAGRGLLKLSNPNSSFVDADTDTINIPNTWYINTTLHTDGSGEIRKLRIIDKSGGSNIVYLEMSNPNSCKIF